jgi:hypothetical protein
MTAIYTGHDPRTDLDGHPGEGCDLLLTQHDDGALELAVRPGKDNRWITWGPPSLLLPEPADMRMPEDHRPGEPGVGS